MHRCPPAELGDWIAEQEGRPQPEAAQCLAEMAVALDALARRLASRACGRVLGPDDPVLGTYAQRLWSCLEYHWRRFAEGSPVRHAATIRRIEEGDLAYGKVNSNVLWEVALAQALELKEEEAAETFEADYMLTVRSVARRVGGQPALDVVENLAAELILPREGKPPRIATFRGKTPLASWLRSVVVNTWVSQTRKRRPQSGDDMPEPSFADDPARTIDESQCEALLRPAFSRAVGALPPEDRLLLKILILDGVPQNRVAKSLGLNPGTLTRRRQRAARAILSSVEQIGAQSGQTRQVTDCLELLLTGGDGTLRRRLADVLARNVNREDQLPRSRNDAL